MDYELPNAEKSLRSAIDAYERAEKIVKDSSDYTADWKRIFSTVSIAHELVVEAEELDRLVTVDDHGPEIITCRIMRAKLLHLEGTVCSSKGMPEHTIQDGVTAFKSYLLLEPRDISAMNLLTRAYIRAYERDNAISLNRQALQIRSSDYKAREIRDELRLDPNLGLQLSTKEPFVETPSPPPPPPPEDGDISLQTAVFIHSVLFFVTSSICVILDLPIQASLIFFVIAVALSLIALVL